jgi:hypothetical protein
VGKYAGNRTTTEKKVIEKIVVVDARGSLFSFLTLFQRRRMTGTLRQARFTSYPRQASEQASDNKQTNSQFSSTPPNTNLHCHLHISPFPLFFFSFLLTVIPQPTCIQPTYRTSYIHVTISPYTILTIHSFTIYTFLSSPPPSPTTRNNRALRSSLARGA